MDTLWFNIVQWLHTLGLHVDGGTARAVGDAAATATAKLDMPSLLALAAALGWAGSSTWTAPGAKSASVAGVSGVVGAVWAVGSLMGDLRRKGLNMGYPSYGPELQVVSGQCAKDLGWPG